MIRYTIGKTPAVLSINIQINHRICFFVPAFHRAKPFQIISHIPIAIINHTNLAEASNISGVTQAAFIISGVIIL